ncbi:hypothetical protein GQ600_2885 [Phytophthora cactorum]|nr:hypothetical protein GQ600_2885 [Phytophthora cactorum]
MQTCASNSSAHHVPALHQECRSRSAAVSVRAPFLQGILGTSRESPRTDRLSPTWPRFSVRSIAISELF